MLVGQAYGDKTIFERASLELGAHEDRACC